MEKNNLNRIITFPFMAAWNVGSFFNNDMINGKAALLTIPKKVEAKPFPASVLD